MARRRFFYWAMIILIYGGMCHDVCGRRPYAAMVMDITTHKILHQENPDISIPPASLTKIMTLYMVFEALDHEQITMDTQLPVSTYASKQSPTKLGLRPGQTIAVRDAILGLITKSANDVAAAIAEYLGGTESQFAAKMTRRAQAIGMDHTVFRNASGLPHPGQRTTVRDMVRLGECIIIHFPHYYNLFATKYFKFQGKSHRNHNGLLFTNHGFDGIKTGFVNASGFNLVSSLQRQGHRLVTVVLGGPTASWRNNRVIFLTEWGFHKLGLPSNYKLILASPPRHTKTYKIKKSLPTKKLYRHKSRKKQVQA